MRGIAVATVFWSAVGALGETCRPPHCLCDDSCRFSGDGMCDDSGPDSDSGRCKFGTDCADCDPRRTEEIGAFLCGNVCTTGREGQCDDGGPGAKTSDCVFGSDCLDCGIRAAGDDCEDGIVELCRDDVVNCAFTDDGTCDDGGEGSGYHQCAFASDCNDCGPRKVHCDMSATHEIDDDDVKTGIFAQYYDDAPHLHELHHAPPPPPVGCHGVGTPRCDPTCNILHVTGDICTSCSCATCRYCVEPKMIHSPPPRAILHPPPPPKVTKFACELLDGRHNLRASDPPTHCYAVSSASECDAAYTYEKDASIPLSLCTFRDGLCSPVHAGSVDLRQPLCQQLLNRSPLPPPPPPLPPREPVPSPPHPRAPSPSPPRPPAPCVPPSAKCGGLGWQGMTTCCSTPGKPMLCFQRDEDASHCRASCDDPSWACHPKDIPRLPQPSPPSPMLPLPMPQPPPSPAPEEMPDDAQLQIRSAVTDPPSAFAVTDGNAEQGTLGILAVLALVFLAVAVGLVIRSSRRGRVNSRAVKLVDGIETSELEDADVSSPRSHLITTPALRS